MTKYVLNGGAVKKDENLKSEKKVFLGGIGILYRKNNGQLQFLVVENSETKNITFVAGAKEAIDSSELETIRREIQEELGLQTEKINFEPTKVRHEFVFGPNKKERAGQIGSYQVFLADITTISDSISFTKELTGIKWLSKNDTLHSLSFPDLKEVFLKAIENLF